MAYTLTNSLGASIHADGMTTLSAWDAAALGIGAPVGNAGTGSSDTKSWSKTAETAASGAGVRGGAVAADQPEGIRELSRLLQLQTEMQRYQLRVEVVSKVAECAVSSIRRLQQQ